MDAELTRKSVSVGVVCMTSADHLMQCLTSLRTQEGAPPFDVTVVCAPGIGGLDDCPRLFPEYRFTSGKGLRSPLQLVSTLLHECRGDVILLTKDHCVPSRDWVRTLVDAQAPGRCAVGGRVESAPNATATDWAFHFIDFYRYVAPVDEGPVSSLTVCNISYQRSALDAVPELWRETFVETVVHDALASRFGSLWLHPDAVVTMHRNLTLGNAIYERYAFGRLFGYSRLATASPGQRIFYALFAPALPVLLLGRMVRAATRSSTQAAACLRSFVPLALMLFGRSWGEWIAYVTRRPPRTMKRSHGDRKY
jgi:hypothetical protein